MPQLKRNIRYKEEKKTFNMQYHLYKDGDKQWKMLIFVKLKLKMIFQYLEY